MALDIPVQRPVLYQQPLSAEGEAGVGEYSEQVLRLMHSLGIDQHKTIEVSTWLYLFSRDENTCGLMVDGSDLRW